MKKQKAAKRQNHSTYQYNHFNTYNIRILQTQSSMLQNKQRNSPITDYIMLNSIYILLRNKLMTVQIKRCTYDMKILLNMWNVQFHLGSKFRTEFVSPPSKLHSSLLCTPYWFQQCLRTHFSFIAFGRALRWKQTKTDI